MTAALSIDIRGESVMARLHGTQERLVINLRRAVNRLSIEVQSEVKSAKLSGQVLHVRTGTLRRSINRKVDETPESITATVGTNVSYAGVHEYGFSGAVNIREHVRKSAAGNAYSVRAHVRQVNLPARSFLRSTLDEKADTIRNTLREAAIAAVKA